MPGDTFIETSNTALASHTPTGTDAGSGWTIEEQTGAISLRVNATLDALEATSAEPNDRVIVTLQPDPLGADYDISFSVAAVSTIATSPIFAIARWVDANNYYGAGVYRGADSPDVVIYKKVAGVVTLLASANAGGFSAGDVLKFEVRNASKKLFRGASELLTTDDNALTAKGRAGVAWGNCFVAADDIGAAWAIDNFSRVDVSFEGVELDTAAAFPDLLGILEASVAAGTSLSVPLDWSAQSEQPMPGDTLIAVATTYPQNITAWSAGWSALATADAGSTHNLYVRSHAFQAGDPTTLDLTFADVAGCVVFVGFTRNAPSIVSSGSAASSNNIAPDSASLAPYWGAANSLWLSIACWWHPTVAVEVDAWPTSYTHAQYQKVLLVIGGVYCGLAVAARQTRTATENPGAYTLDASSAWIAFTFSIPPSGETDSVPDAGEDLSMMVRTVTEGISGLVKRLEIINDSGRSITVVIEGNSTSHSETVATGATASEDILALAIPDSAHSVTIT